METAGGMESKSLGLHPGLRLASCVTSDKFLTLSDPCLL